MERCDTALRFYGFLHFLKSKLLKTTVNAKFTAPSDPFRRLCCFFGFKESTLPSIAAVLTWILTTPVQFWVGARFFRGAWNGLKHCNFGMDFLVAFGTGTAYFYSVLSILVGCTNENFHGKHFFETSTMLITFVVFGKYLESVAKGKTSEALSKLMGMQVKTAVRVELSPSDNTTVLREEEVDLAVVKVGNIVKVLPGGKVPTDGVVIRGNRFYTFVAPLTVLLLLSENVPTSFYGLN